MFDGLCRISGEVTFHVRNLNQTRFMEQYLLFVEINQVTF